MRLGLEADADSELDLTRGADDVVDLSGSGIRGARNSRGRINCAVLPKTVYRLRPVGVVRDIEDLGTELNVEGFGDLSYLHVFQDGHI